MNLSLRRQLEGKNTYFVNAFKTELFRVSIQKGAISKITLLLNILN